MLNKIFRAAHVNILKKKKKNYKLAEKHVDCANLSTII